MERMNRILEFDPTDRSVTCQAGVVTSVAEFRRDHGLYYPVDLPRAVPARSVATDATNAGGIKVVRHGLTRDWVTD